MLPGERRVGGLWCAEVLALLPDAVDRALSPADAAKVEAHVTRCANCARFGAEYADLVRRLAALGDAERGVAG